MKERNTDQLKKIIYLFLFLFLYLGFRSILYREYYMAVIFTSLVLYFLWLLGKGQGRRTGK
ncbi:MAG: hypothetical protein JW827_02970 [Spirochaetes bacterium]|nr:hypothetical protein [Spirochaetota bacterium]